MKRAIFQLHLDAVRRGHTWCRRYRTGLLATLMAVLLTGCFGTNTPQRRYYTLSLPRGIQPSASKRVGELWVKEVQVSPVYNRPQIVYRYSPQELQLFHQSIWADRPSRMLGQLVRDTLRSGSLFASVVEHIGANPPSHVFESSVIAIEELQGDQLWYAHLAMTFRLMRFSDKKVMWQYSFDERRSLNRADLALVVRALSEILEEQMRIVLREVDAVLSDRTQPGASKRQARQQTTGAIAAKATAPAIAASAGPVRPIQPTHTRPANAPPANPPPTYAPPTDAPPTNPRPTSTKQAALTKAPTTAEVYDTTNGMRVDWTRSAQYQSDRTVVPIGKGAIFLPALSTKPHREPGIRVLRAGRLVASGAMGQRIALPPGDYEVVFGSGSVSQGLVRQVTVTEDKTSVVKPNWATLDISVMNSKFIPFPGSYEIIRMGSQDYLGAGFGVDEQIGQTTQVWLLTPGLYKIVRPGSTYRARTDFSTVLLLPGMAVNYNLILDEITANFLGAGVAMAAPKASSTSPWQLRSSIGGSVLLTRRSEGYSSAVTGSGLNVDLFSDHRLRFTKRAHLWTTRLEVEEGQTLQPTIGPDNKPGDLLDGRLQSVKDRLYFNTMYIYQALPWVGPYLRVGAETALFYRETWFAKPTEVVVQDVDGKEIDRLRGPENKGESSITLAGPFSPVQLKEGVGVNFSIQRGSSLDLNLRTGLGSRQYFARDQLVPHDNSATTPFEVREVATTTITGVEMSAIGILRLTRYLQGSTEMDMLIPFEGFRSTQLTWRNALSLRLGTFATLTYTLNVVRQPNVRPDLPWATEQGLQLRFYYSPF